jgi:predicted CXXCH cytochrome family protein
VLAGFAGLGWEFGQLTGLIATLLCIGLCGAPVRPRNSSPPALLTLRAHTFLGWAAAGAVAVHVGWLLLADHHVLEYLKPSMPIYMGAGVLAALLLVLLSATATSSTRARLWRSHRAFQVSHVIAGSLLIALVAVHVIATRRYAGGPVRTALMLGTTAGAMCMLLRRGRRARPSADAAPRRRLVFGSRSGWVAGVLVVTAGGLVALMLGASATALREPLASRSTPLVLDFPHPKHVKVNCLVCHHNYADGRGFENCVSCHRSARTDLKVGLQARFHAFCYECHRHPKAALAAHGPVAGCAACHHPP